MAAEDPLALPEPEEPGACGDDSNTDDICDCLADLLDELDIETCNTFPVSACDTTTCDEVSVFMHAPACGDTPTAIAYSVNGGTPIAGAYPGVLGPCSACLASGGFDKELACISQGETCQPVWVTCDFNAEPVAVTVTSLDFATTFEPGDYDSIGLCSGCTEPQVCVDECCDADGAPFWTLTVTEGETVTVTQMDKGADGVLVPSADQDRPCLTCPDRIECLEGVCIEGPDGSALDAWLLTSQIGGDGSALFLERLPDGTLAPMADQDQTLVDCEARTEVCIVDCVVGLEDQTVYKVTTYGNPITIVYYTRQADGTLAPLVDQAIEECPELPRQEICPVCIVGLEDQMVYEVTTYGDPVTVVYYIRDVDGLLVALPDQAVEECPDAPERQEVCTVCLVGFEDQTIYEVTTYGDPVTVIFYTRDSAGVLVPLASQDVEECPEVDAVPIVQCRRVDISWIDNQVLPDRPHGGALYPQDNWSIEWATAAGVSGTVDHPATGAGTWGANLTQLAALLSTATGLPYAFTVGPGDDDDMTTPFVGHVSAQICPTDDPVVKVTATTVGGPRDGRVIELATGYVVGEVEQLRLCVDCGDSEPVWSTLDGVELADPGPCLSPSCTFPDRPVLPVSECVGAVEGPFCHITPQVDDDGNIADPTAADIVRSGVFLELDCSGQVLSFFTLDGEDPEPYAITDGGFIGDCNSLAPVDGPEPCIDCIEWENVTAEIHASLLDNNGWPNRGNLLRAEHSYDIETTLVDGTVFTWSIPAFGSGQYTAQVEHIRDVWAGLMPECSWDYSDTDGIVAPAPPSDIDVPASIYRRFVLQRCCDPTRLIESSVITASTGGAAVGSEAQHMPQSYETCVQRCISCDTGTIWRDENGDPLTGFDIPECTSLGCAERDCWRPSGKLLCYGAAGGSTIEYANQDNTTDLSASSNSTTIKWSIQLGQEADADATGPFIADCIASGQVAKISYVTTDGITFTFDANAVLADGSASGGWAFTGTATSATGAGEIVSASVTCGEVGGVRTACEWSSCGVNEWRDTLTGEVLTAEQIQTLTPCQPDPECPTDIIEVVQCADGDQPGASDGDYILVVYRVDCNGVGLDAQAQNLTTNEALDSVPDLVSCDPEPTLLELRDCLIDATGQEFTQIQIIDTATAPPTIISTAFISSDTLGLGVPAGDPSEWTNCPAGLDDVVSTDPRPCDVECSSEVVTFDSSNANVDTAISDPATGVWTVTPAVGNTNTSMHQLLEAAQSGNCAVVAIYVRETLLSDSSGWLVVPAAAVSGDATSYTIDPAIAADFGACSAADAIAALEAGAAGLTVTNGGGFQSGPLISAELNTIAFDTPPDGSANGRCLQLTETLGSVEPYVRTFDECALEKLCDIAALLQAQTQAIADLATSITILLGEGDECPCVEVDDDGSPLGDQVVCASRKLGADFQSSASGEATHVAGSLFDSNGPVLWSGTFTVTDSAGVTHQFANGQTVTGLASGSVQSVTYTGQIEWTDPGTGETFRCPVTNKAISAGFIVQ